MSDYYTITGHYTQKDYLVEAAAAGKSFVLTIWEPRYWSLPLSYSVRAGRDVRCRYLWVADWKAQLHVRRLENRICRDHRRQARAKRLAESRGGVA